jgi:Flp pilus assembly protein TadG
MAGILILLRSLLGLQSSGTLDYVNAVGQVGTAYTTIPPNNKAGGQVEVLIQGRLSMAEAVNTSLVPIVPGTKVIVVDKISHSTLIVEPL